MYLISLSSPALVEHCDPLHLTKSHLIDPYFGRTLIQCAEG